MTPKCSQEQEALKPQSQKRKKKRLRNADKTNHKEFINIDFDMLVNYCLHRVTWEEARPVVEVMERQELLTPSPTLRAAIDKIKRHFNRKIYGRPVSTDHVNVIKPRIYGSFNKISRNNKVNFGRQYEKQKE
jgi:hypothetical protein